MKSTCPHCGTTYRIDPRKVPSGGVQARCSRCGGAFRIEDQAARAGISSPPPPRPTAVDAQPAPSLPTAVPTGPDYEGQVDLPELAAPPEPAPPPRAPAVEPPPPIREAPAAFQPESAPAAAPPPPAAPSHAEADRAVDRPAASVPRPPPLFGRPDPHGKARRLARALVSDIAVYNPERRDRGIAEGTLRQEFRDEIRKSWDEYVAQVGESIARSTPYFREALNDILAGGRTVF